MQAHFQVHLLPKVYMCFESPPADI